MPTHSNIERSNIHLHVTDVAKCSKVVICVVAIGFSIRCGQYRNGRLRDAMIKGENKKIKLPSLFPTVGV